MYQYKVQNNIHKELITMLKIINPNHHLWFLPLHSGLNFPDLYFKEIHRTFYLNHSCILVDQYNLFYQLALYQVKVHPILNYLMLAKITE